MLDCFRHQNQISGSRYNSFMWLCLFSERVDQRRENGRNRAQVINRALYDLYHVISILEISNCVHDEKWRMGLLGNSSQKIVMCYHHK